MNTVLPSLLYNTGIVQIFFPYSITLSNVEGLLNSYIVYSKTILLRTSADSFCHPAFLLYKHTLMYFFTSFLPTLKFLFNNFLITFFSNSITPLNEKSFIYWCSILYDSTSLSFFHKIKKVPNYYFFHHSVHILSFSASILVLLLPLGMWRCLPINRIPMQINYFYLSSAFSFPPFLHDIPFPLSLFFLFLPFFITFLFLSHFFIFFFKRNLSLSSFHNYLSPLCFTIVILPSTTMTN